MVGYSCLLLPNVRKTIWSLSGFRQDILQTLSKLCMFTRRCEGDCELTAELSVMVCFRAVTDF